MSESEEYKPGDHLINISAVNREFRRLAQANQWQAYHTPKNLAAAVAVEASELLAEFQWLTPEQSTCLEPEQQSRVADEVADVIMYLSELCAQLCIDPAQALRTKIARNAKRYIKVN
jgi:NTP pyrophosphatase (non-canonical NTP hydrolase)